jgi:hypothetical protein
LKSPKSLISSSLTEVEAIEIAKIFGREKLPEFVWASKLYPKALLLRSSRAVVAEYDILSKATLQIGAEPVALLFRLLDTLALGTSSDFLYVFDTGLANEALVEVFGHGQIEFLRYDDRKFESAFKSISSLFSMDLADNKSFAVLEERSEAWIALVSRFLVDAQKIASKLKAGQGVLVCAANAPFEFHEEMVGCLILVAETILDPELRTQVGLTKALVREFGIRGKSTATEAGAWQGLIL